jgi:hypothetical protein
MKQMLLLVVLAAVVVMPVRAQNPAVRPSTPLGQARCRSASCTPTRKPIAPSPAVHGGAGTMSFTALLNRGAVTPEFNFLHRGVIPAGAGIGHHFHNVVEEMFVILDGERSSRSTGAQRRERAGRCAVPDGALSRDLQPGTGAGAVDEPERVAPSRRLRQLRSWRHPRSAPPSMRFPPS